MGCNFFLFDEALLVKCNTDIPKCNPKSPGCLGDSSEKLKILLKVSVRTIKWESSLHSSYFVSEELAMPENALCYKIIT